MDNQNLNITQPAPEVPSRKKKILKVLGIIVLTIIIIFGLLAWWGFSIEEEERSNQQNMNTTTSGQYTEAELEQMLTGGDSTRQKEAVNYVIAHPEMVNPFDYAIVARSLFADGNRAQGAFWFYIFQSRTVAWVEKDPNKSGSSALKASLNEVLGRPINEWIGSDVQAWYDLVVRAISYEKKFSFYGGKIESVSDKEWQQTLIEKRKEYEEGFTLAFKDMKEMVKDSGEQRKSNGLYVGPWQDPGQPLPESWR